MAALKFSKRILTCVSRLVILGSAIVLLTECASQKRLPRESINQVALMATTINFKQTSGISGPAAIARAQFRNRAAEINTLMEMYVDSLHQAIASSLKTQIGCEVIYGQKLHECPNFENVRTKYEITHALHKEDDYFPEVLISKDDFNFLISGTNTSIGKGGITSNFRIQEIGETIQNICRDLNVSHLAVAQVYLTGIRKNLILPTDTYLYFKLFLFDKNGKCIATHNSSHRTVKMLQIDLAASYEDMLNSLIDRADLYVLKANK